MIRIVADSSCAITREEAQKLNIEIIPLPIEIDNQNYLDGINLTTEEFYKKLTECKNLPTTSQPSPLEFIERFEQAKQSGDSILVITLSSKISGTYENACLYKKEIEYSEIEIVDSLTTIGAMKMIVQEAIKQRDKGLNVHELADYLNKFKLRTKIWGAIDTLEYLYKGGRLSGATKIIGTMLNIKPIISVIDGYVKMVDKKMGIKNALDCIFNLSINGNIDKSYPVCVQYSYNKERALKLEQMLHDAGITDTYIEEISCVVGTHIGPNGSAIVYIEKENAN